MSRLNKRLFTHQQIQSEANRVGVDYPSTHSLNFIVYYRNGKSPIDSAKTLVVNAYNRSVEVGELEDGRYTIDEEGKWVIASKIVFGEYLEIFLDDVIDIPKEMGIKGMRLEEFIDWMWVGTEHNVKEGIKPLNKSQKKRVLQGFHTYANGRGNHDIEFIDFNLRKNKLI